MSSTDIYKTKESPWVQEQQKKASSSQRRRRRSAGKTFDQAVNPDLANTHKRRSRNSGFRRLQHLLKRPDFAKRFWGTIIGVSAITLITLLVWDLFFRYPDSVEESAETPIPTQQEAK